jgi:hypothetical protein
MPQKVIPRQKHSQHNHAMKKVTWCCVTKKRPLQHVQVHYDLLKPQSHPIAKWPPHRLGYISCWTVVGHQISPSNWHDLCVNYLVIKLSFPSGFWSHAILEYTLTTSQFLLYLFSSVQCPHIKLLLYFVIINIQNNMKCW